MQVSEVSHPVQYMSTEQMKGAKKVDDTAVNIRYVPIKLKKSLKMQLMSVTQKQSVCWSKVFCLNVVTNIIIQFI